MSMNTLPDQCQQTGNQQAPPPKLAQGNKARLQVEVFSQDHTLYVKVELPGLRADQVELRIVNGLLAILPAWEGRAKDSGRWAGLIGSSPAFNECLQRLQQTAAGNCNVLLQGESGTGKELLARKLHEYSPQSCGKFVAVDCTALPEALTDRLLLEGAGDASNEALFHSCGLLQKACHGTLFLDAVSELSPPVQAILLHVLQERHCQPDGDSLGIGSNFRVVASSRYDLRERTASGRFHRDLLRCLEERRIDVPALRQRIEDIPALAVWHVGRLCHRLEVPVKALTPEFIDILCRYSWPGNVRELVNVLKQSLLMAHRENTLFAKHLPQHIRIQVARSSLACRTVDLEAPCHVPPGKIPSLQDFRINIRNLAEKRYLSHLVQQSGSDTAIACQLTGLSRSRLYALLKKHNITLH